MTHDPASTPADDRRLDEMTAALRDAGGREADALPPEVRRATLEALWVADANRYEGRTARNSKLAKYATIVVAAAVVLAAGGTFINLAIRAVEQRNDAMWNSGYARNTAPPAVVYPATTEAAPANGIAADPDAPPPLIEGRAVFLGTRPEPAVIDLAAAPECRSVHGPLLDDSLVIGDGGGLANVVVSIARADGAPLGGPLRPGPGVLDQRGCQYVPHVLGVMTGQPLLVKNSDRFLHNVHSLSTQNPNFNFGQPTLNPGTPLPPMQAPERFKIKCDVHPWMSAYVNVFSHPYFAVTDIDGAFAVPGQLPAGYYTVTAWHEKLGEKQVSVRVTGGTPATADFVFDGSALREP